MKKNKISKNWLIKKKKDIFFRESKIQGYRSRSAFKLIEMNKKFIKRLHLLALYSRLMFFYFCAYNEKNL